MSRAGRGARERTKISGDTLPSGRDVRCEQSADSYPRESVRTGLVSFSEAGQENQELVDG
jgi:hypothetical protein